MKATTTQDLFAFNKPGPFVTESVLYKSKNNQPPFSQTVSKTDELMNNRDSLAL